MKKIFLMMVFFAYSAFCFFSLDVPFLSGHVNDYSAVLDNGTRAALEKKLSAFEKETTDQIAVLIINSLDGENLEEFSIKVAEKWKLGRKGKDNGVLLLVVINDRKLRIEVGRGLEEYLTDIRCAQIIRTRITPSFKANNYNEGITAGVEAAIGVISGDNTIDKESKSDAQLGTKSKNSIDSQVDGMDIYTRVLIGLFVFGIIGLFTIIGILIPKGGAGWFLYFFLIPFWAVFPIIIVGTKIAFYIVITYLIVYPLAKIFLNVGAKHISGLKKFQNFFQGSGGKGGRSGFLSSGSSGSHSSGFSSSSSFSGGGGSFSGGGSSGSW